MVAIFTGAGVGFERGSGSTIGNAGLLGSASHGRSGEQVFLNAATGNLMVTHRDEFLVGKGPDAAVSRTYNSLGDLSDDNGDNWRQSTDRRIYGLTGTLNAAGSTVRRVSADGTDVVYRWKNGAYVNGDTGGAADTLTCSGDVWTWTDGGSQVTERYEANGTGSWRITRQTDTDGLYLSFSYDATSGKLTQISTSDGGTITYGWSGNRIDTITTGGTIAGNAGVRTRYKYDAQGRLGEVRVDLTPDDSSDADGRTYSTFYTYHGATTRIASISQTDGSKVEFTYDASGRVDSYTQAVADGVSHTTTIAYQAARTVITSAGDSVTVLDYGAEGALQKITAPPAQPGGTPQTVQFTYGGGAAIASPAGSSVVGNSVTKTAEAGWGNQVAYGEEVMTGSAVLRFRLDDPNIAGKYQQVGLSTVANRDVVGSDYTNGAFEAGIYFDDSSNSPMLWMGTALGWQRCAATVTGTSSDLWTVAYDGAKFHYLKNDTLLLSIDAAAGLELVFKHRGASQGATARDISYSTLPKLISGGGSLIVADSITNTAATGAWSTQLAYSDQVMNGTASVSFRLDDPVGRDKWQQVGLTSPQWASYQGSVWNDFFAAGIFFWGNSETIQVTNGDTWETLAMTGTSADVWTIAYDGNEFSFSKNGTVFKTLAGTVPNMNLAFKYRSPSPGTVIRDIKFGTPAGGRLAAVTDSAGGVTRYDYDSAGNIVREVDPLGNVVTRTFGSRNELRSETRRGSSPDAADAPLTTHFVYDDELHLRYAVRPSGEVVEHRYHPDGELQYSIEYTDHAFAVGAAAPSRGDLDTWRASVPLSKRLVTEHFYDARGNLQQTRLLGTDDAQQNTYVTYDRAGQLLARAGAGLNVERFVYDGLGRVTASVDLNGGTTSILFRDAAGQTVVTLASGLIETATYNKAGELIAKTSSTGIDYMQNGDLAAGTDGWTLSGASRAPNDAGTPAYVFEATGSGSATSALQRLPNAESVLLSFAAKPQVVHQQFHTWIDWYDAQQNHIGFSVMDRFPGSTGEFTTFQQQLTRPAGAAYIRISTTAIGQTNPPAGSKARWGDYKLTIGNHIANAGLETGTAGWDGSNVARVAAPAGSPVAWLFKQGGPNDLGISSTSLAAVPETTTLYLSYMVKGGAQNQVFQTDINWFDAQGVSIGGSSFTRVPGAAGFARYEHEVTKPLGAVTYSVRMMAHTVPGGINATAEWGDLRLAPAPQTAGAASAVQPSRESFAYDKHGRVRVAIDPSGTKSYFVYDQAGRKIASVDDHWRMTEFVYDRGGRLVQTIGYAEPVVEASDRNILADPNFPTDIATLRPVASAGDVRSWNVYDQAGRLVSTIGNDGSVSTLAYDKSSRLIRTIVYAAKLTDTQLQQIVAAPPTQPVLPAADAANDSVTRSFYDKDGRLVATLDGEGFLTRSFFDKAGQKIEEVRYATAAPATGTLRAEGTLAAIESAIAAASNPADAHDDRRTRFVHDGFGRLRFQLDGFNQAVEHVYDSNGRVIQTNAYNAKLQPSQFDFASVDLVVAPLRASPETRKSFTVYDAASRAIFSIDAEGGVTGFAYDSAGRVVKTVRYGAKLVAEQAPTAANMDAWLQLGGVQLGGQRVARSYYNAKGELRYSVDAAGYVTRFDYDIEGRKTGEVRWDNPVADVTDATSLDALATLATGTWTRSSWTYDSLGRLIEQRDAENRGTSYGYDGFGRLKTEQAIGAGESVKSYTYDKAGRVETETVTSGTNPADKATVAYEYDSFGNVRSVKDARNNSTTRTYDRLGRLLIQTDAIGGKTEYLYNGFGEAVRVKDARGAITHNYFDRLGRLTLSVDALGYATATEYTTFGEVKSVRRHYGRVLNTSPDTVPAPAVDEERDSKTSFTYDERGLVLTSTDAQGKTESYAYTNYGERSSVTNRETGVTTSKYDVRGLLVEETATKKAVRSSGSVQAEEVTNRFQYDARGNRTKTIEADGLDEKRTTIFVYDKSNRLIETRGDAVSVLVNADDAAAVQRVPTETLKYDGAGRLVERVDALGGRTLYGYDFLGNVDREVGPLGTFTSRTFDRNGNVLSVRTYEQAVALPQGSSAVPAAPAGAYRETTYSYDVLNRLEKTAVAGLTVGAWAAGAYQTQAGAAVETIVRYDGNGNVLWQQDGTGARTYSWYDALNRKIGQRDAEGYYTAWTLDKDGNVEVERRHTVKVDVTGDTPLLPEPATHADDRVTEFTYDRNGRRLTETRLGVVAWTVNPVTGALDPASTAATIRYKYNGLGQVAEKIEANGDTVTYVYDRMGRLTTETRAAFKDHTGQDVSPTLVYSYDGLDQLTRTAQGGSGADVRITRNEYGAGGRLLQSIDSANAARSYAYDAAGNLLRERYSRTRSDGTPVAEAVLYVRDALGRVTMQTVATENGASWLKGDRIHTRYNQFGEMSERGVSGTDVVAGSLQEQFSYDAGGRLWRSNAGDGVRRFFLYDKAGRQTLTLESEGADLSGIAGLDGVIAAAAKNLATGGEYEAGVNVSITVYDKRGLATATILPERELKTGQANVTLYSSRTYNAFGEVASETGALGHETNGTARADATAYFKYNAMGRLIEKQNPIVLVTGENGVSAQQRPTEDYFYDLSGRMVGLEDANGFRTRRLLLAGTGHGGGEALVVREFHPDGGIVATGYDGFGDARVRTDEINRSTTRRYDAMGRVVEENHPGGLKVEYAYDELGQRIRHWNSFLTGPGSVERTDYDRQGRVVSHVAFGGDTTTIAYAWDGSIATGGMGAFGGWTKTTTYANTKTSLETEDLFGRQLSKQDMGARVFTSAYDLAGRLTSRSGGETVTYSWHNSGVAAGVATSGGTASAYGYDSAGNRTSELTTRNGSIVQNATASWDALARLTAWTELGGAGTPAASVVYAYDAAGNIRSTQASYQLLGEQGLVQTNINGDPITVSQTYWNLFDSMNRHILAKGTLTGGQIWRGEEGIQIEYDAAGQRMSTLRKTDVSEKIWRHKASNGIERYYHERNWDVFGGTWSHISWDYKGLRRETFKYNGDGSIDRIDVAQSMLNFEDGSQALPVGAIGGSRLLSDHSYDAMGRLVRQIDYDVLGNEVFDRSVEMNGKGQITRDTVNTIQSGYTYRTISDYQYGTGSGYALGAVTKVTADTYRNNNDGDLADTETTTSYQWWDGAVASVVTHDRDSNSSNSLYTSTYHYNGLGQLGSVSIVDGRTRTVTFTNDAAGQIVRRDESDGLAGGDPHEVFYRFGGKQLGFSGNNGTSETDYQASVEARAKSGTGAFRGGAAGMSAYADFAMGHAPVTASGDAGAGGYTVRSGETLSSIAANLWGDSSLWYKLAEANGLSAASALVEGQSLIVPPGVTNNSYNASTFRPYEPGEAMGDLSPTTPKPPKKNKCAILGTIMLVAVAVAVTVATSGALLAASGAVSGGLGAGISATLGIGGATGAAAGVSTAALIGAGAVGGAVGSAVSQGLGIATGLQNDFNWKSVAMGALGGAVGGATGVGGVFGRAGAFAGVGNNFIQGALRGVLSNGLTQGIALATKLQAKFDFAGVAAAGLGGGVAAATGRAIGLDGARLTGVMVGKSLTAGMAGGIANAAARSLIDGTDFGDNIIATLPDVIASTIGGILGAAAHESYRASPQGAVRQLVTTAAAGAPLTREARQAEQTLVEAVRAVRADPSDLAAKYRLEQALNTALETSATTPAAREQLADFRRIVLRRTQAPRGPGGPESIVVNGDYDDIDYWGSRTIDRTGIWLGEKKSEIEGAIQQYLEDNPHAALAMNVANVGLAAVSPARAIGGAIVSAFEDNISGMISDGYRRVGWEQDDARHGGQGITFGASAVLNGIGGIGSISLAGRRAQPRHAVDNALRDFQTREFRAGSNIYRFDRSALKHSLERHHPDFWSNRPRSRNTSFDPSLTPDDVADIAMEGLRQNRRTLTDLPFSTVRGTELPVVHNGINYVIAVRGGRVTMVSPVGD